MCGIAGILSRDLSAAHELSIKKAADIMAHRGPSREGFWMNAGRSVLLGHRRLCIIDLSEAASQPMTYNGRYHLVFNGELYNYIELRDELRQKGHSFTTSSDTEVVLACYAEYGKDCLGRFDGMFAFAIWDDSEKTLFAARDRFGEKPFFFFYDKDRFVFASELKALWEMNVQRDVNTALLYNFLTIGYTSNPADPTETFYRDIQKLPAASFLTYSASAGELSVEKYWQVFIGQHNDITEEDAVIQFRELFAASVKRRLRSDVPIGTSLSGGLDSSAVVAFCDKEASGHYSHKCFTGYFPGFERSEQRFAEIVAGKFHLQHHLVTVQDHEVPHLMQKVMAAQEVPFSSASPLLQYKVYEEAGRHVSVLLDGQGADEVLAGYHRYYRWYWQELYRQGKLSKSGELKNARKLGVSEPFGLMQRAAALAPHFASSILEAVKSRKAYRRRDINRDFAFSNKQSLYYAAPAEFGLNHVLYHNTFVNGLEELLHLADRNSMAHSVEVRLPFLDHGLVEFLFTLPPHFKIRNGWTKWLLREATEDMLPLEIVWRKDKTAFEPPQKKWMQSPGVQESIHEAKKLLTAHGILDPSVMNSKIQPHNAYDAVNNDWKYWSASWLFHK